MNAAEMNLLTNILEAARDDRASGYGSYSLTTHLDSMRSDPLGWADDWSEDTFSVVAEICCELDRVGAFA